MYDLVHRGLSIYLYVGQTDLLAWSNLVAIETYD
jgi:hypothetical protein